MSKDTLILLHPPSVYDFRNRTTLWGPISDLVPSTPIFDMYPIGFTTIAEYLERKGYRVRIVNLAVRMLGDPEFNVEEFIGSLDPTMFGIDLHWLPHAHGALEVARIIKRIHPRIPLVMGGLSASYFHEELIGRGYTDYVLRGDTTEEPLRQLIDCIASGSRSCDLGRIPNLVWKDTTGNIRVNPMSHVPRVLDDILVDYSFSLRAVLRDMNITNNLPFSQWLKYPITAALTCRGCTRNCSLCGGSAYAYRTFYGRKQPAFRSPERLAQDLRRIKRYSYGPVFILGDIRQAGMEYARRFLHAIQGIDTQVILEFFWPVEREFIEEVAGALPNFTIQLSPESHDTFVLRHSGKLFTGESIKSSIQYSLDAGCRRFDLFFMVGLPGQSIASALDGVHYFRHLAESLDGDPRLRFFISPLAPFLDPGSLVYEQPERFGYRKMCYNLLDHHNALTAPSWKYVLSYETRWMNRSEIVDTTYRAAFLLNRLKAEFGHVLPEQAERVESRIMRARELIKRIDVLVSNGSFTGIQSQLDRLKPSIEEVNNSTVCEKEELNLPVHRRGIKILKATGLIIEDGIRNLILKRA